MVTSTLMLSLSPRVGVAKMAETQVGEEKRTAGKLLLGMVLFDGFQLLNTFGPLEMFGSLRDEVSMFSRKILNIELIASIPSQSGSYYLAGFVL